MAGYRISMGGWSYKPTDEIIHEANSLDRQVHDASVELTADGMSKLTFTMPPTHPLAVQIELLRYGSTDKSISLYFDDTQLFHGVVVSKAEDINGEITVTCKDDGVMLEQAYISLITSDLSNKDTAEHVVQKILAEYNALVPNDLYVGIGDVPDVGYEYGGSNVVDMPASGKAMTALDALRSCFGPYGCTVKVTPYIGTVSQYAELNVYDGSHGDSTQVVQFGENLTDYTSEVFDEGIYTAAMPVGRSYNVYRAYNSGVGTITRNASKGSNYLYFTNPNDVFADLIVVGEEYVEYKVKERQQQSSTEDRAEIDPVLDVALSSGDKIMLYSGVSSKVPRPRMLDSIADGTYKSGKYQKTGKTIYNVSAVQRYGVRTMVIDMPDEGHSSVLLNKAMTALEGHPTVPLMLEIEAVDMALYMDGYTHLTAGQTLRVMSDVHGVDMTMMVSDIRINLDDPSGTRYTLGARPDTISGRIEADRLNMAVIDDNLMYRLRTL